MELLSVCTGNPTAFPAKPEVGKTGYFKLPVDGPVQVNPLGLDDDTICDLDHHGGVDQAVYIFGEPDALWWRDKLGKPCPPGFFGENLRISDVESAQLCLGDIFKIGDVRLQITSSRIPCLTYHTVMGGGAAMKDFYTAARPGAYARVLTTGTIHTGDKVLFTPYAGTKITIIENMRAYQDNFTDVGFLRRALTVPAHYKLHDEARERLA